MYFPLNKYSVNIFSALNTCSTKIIHFKTFIRFSREIAVIILDLQIILKTLRKTNQTTSSIQTDLLR